MKIFLVRHGKSDKGLKDTLSHHEFELRRPLVAEAVEKARKLGEALKNQVGDTSRLDLVFSGRLRSKQTVMAIAEGLGVTPDQAQTQLREEFGLAYLAAANYWEACEAAIHADEYHSHAEYFLANPPTGGQTFSAQYMQSNLRTALRRAIERNTFLGLETSIMVSHEPVISLCMSDLTNTSVADLGGQCSELEMATFEVTASEHSFASDVTLTYRGERYRLDNITQ